MQASQSNGPAVLKQFPRGTSAPDIVRPEVGWWRHVRLGLIVWLHAGQLDRQLAAGMSPGASELLALRAQRIPRRRSRLRLAATAAFEAEDTTPGAVRPHPRELSAAGTVLDVLDRRLRDRGPVTARGAAMLRVLTRDESPLHRPSGPGELGSRLRGAAAALEPAKGDAPLPESAQARVRWPVSL